MLQSSQESFNYFSATDFNQAKVYRKPQSNYHNFSWPVFPKAEAKCGSSPGFIIAAFLGVQGRRKSWEIPPPNLSQPPVTSSKWFCSPPGFHHLQAFTRFPYITCPRPWPEPNTWRKFAGSMFSLLTNQAHESFYQWQAAIATAAGFITSSPATRELASTRTPQPPTLNPTPRKALKILEKAKFINYTHPRIGWKRTLTGMLQPSLLIKIDLKRATDNMNNHPRVLFSWVI